MATRHSRRGRAAMVRAAGRDRGGYERAQGAGVGAGGSSGEARTPRTTTGRHGRAMARTGPKSGRRGGTPAEGARAGGAGHAASPWPTTPRGGAGADPIEMEFYNSFHKAPERVTSSSWPGNCCYRRTLHKAIACPIRTDLATHRLSICLQGFDWSFRSDHLSVDGRSTTPSIKRLKG
jgi:hypothetical protein